MLDINSWKLTVFIFCLFILSSAVAIIIANPFADIPFVIGSAVGFSGARAIQGLIASLILWAVFRKTLSFFCILSISIFVHMVSTIFGDLYARLLL